MNKNLQKKSIKIRRMSNEDFSSGNGSIWRWARFLDSKLSVWDQLSVDVRRDRINCSTNSKPVVRFGNRMFSEYSGEKVTGDRRKCRLYRCELEFDTTKQKCHRWSRKRLSVNRPILQKKAIWKETSKMKEKLCYSISLRPKPQEKWLLKEKFCVDSWRSSSKRKNKFKWIG